MKTCDLLTFSTVARCASITAAAKELNTVQSNVTSRIRSLEEFIGLPLLERHSRGVTLTRAGNRLLPYAQRTLAMLEEASRVTRDEGEASGTITIGSMETTLAVRLPDILASFHDCYQDVQLAMTIDATAFLIDKVLNCEADGAFVAGPVDHPLLAATPVFSEELVLVTTRGIRDPQQLKDNPRGITALMFKQGCAYRQRLEQYLTWLGRPSFQRMEFGSLDGMLGCISAGVGITLLPRSVVEKSGLAERLQVHEVIPAISRVPTLFITRNDVQPTTALKRFVRCVKDHSLAGQPGKSITVAT
ncbi:LysR family transcriptional regulator [Tatumella morbirosei]|uniref:LysR family transcriptional regulator n=1 Tax=Tatumella morbirosei TaxID=642227 RepID=UPI00062A372C|nr:LysR family transcriptional regulator [Tatumella morbirosei]